MTVFRNEGAWDASNVEYVDGAIVAYDKQRRNPRMHHIDYGLGVLDRRALALVPADQRCDLADLLLAAAKNMGIYAQRMGTVQGGELTLPGTGAISVAERKAANEAWLPAYMAQG